ncbi:hypothetical protein SAMN04487906_0660 [Zhouia amylolytica]|uniref:BNR/Asp-box repeat protein n=2 Tax=Zhouia amylolytica TaxID=376730 RepID=W2UP69_9FLAO|nr:oxidoreductase [Zhouia amylolytica]ETN95975.1 BNR/Asp-box repeat protein [Zhouia amylolytica AD3]MCQ0111263.1 oxidoreductase [Zhouia amylolytica]SFS51899.1 hypothetical protein SAMN04487906_0660 [Zhouia amylolytica]
MKKLMLLPLVLLMLVVSCKQLQKEKEEVKEEETEEIDEIKDTPEKEADYVARDISEVDIVEIYDGELSIRAITIMQGNLAFAGSKNTYGIYNTDSKTTRTSTVEFDSLDIEFRAVASTSSDFYMLSIANPAILIKTGDNGQLDLVYKEEHEKVFYDSMTFWNDLEGIAMGDPVEDCISIIITRDGGKTWRKLTCDILPTAAEGEAAFAASDTNIKVVGDKTWIVTGGTKSRVLYSPDKGETWEVFDTPIVTGDAKGIYSVDFYDDTNGIVIGGSFKEPNDSIANKAVTNDGGKTWKLVASGQAPGYRSCVQYVPGGMAKEIVALGFKGIDYSKDGGVTWKHLSDESFYTLRFLNDSVAYAAGNNRIAKLTLRE